MSASDTKEVLLDKLIGIQDIEAAKPVEEMDTDMISVCSGCIIALTEEELPSARALEQMQKRLLDRLFGRNANARKARKGIRRKLLIAAIVAILIVAMAVSVMPLGTNDESLVHRWGFGILYSRQGERIEYDDYITLIKGGKVEEYKSIHQFIRRTHMDILVPTKLPKGVSVRNVRAYFEYTFECPLISFVTNDPSVYSVIVRLGKEIDLSESTEQKDCICDYECSFSVTSDWCQCDFNHNSNGYTITAKTYEELILILNNMKGSLEK